MNLAKIIARKIAAAIITERQTPNEPMSPEKFMQYKTNENTLKSMEREYTGQDPNDTDYE